MSSSSSSSSSDLLVFGAGHLGCRVATLWKEKYGASPRITLMTGSVNLDRLRKWSAMGYKNLGCSSAKGGVVDWEQPKYPNVLFCVPPSGKDSPTYRTLLEWAFKLWDKKGCFVFTSSGGVYAADDGKQRVDESSELKTDSERTDLMVEAEKMVQNFDGDVIRLAGLYLVKRGAHNYWFNATKGTQLFT